MTKEQIITKIKESGLVAVIRAATPDEALKITRACIEGGVGNRAYIYRAGAENIIQALIKNAAADNYRRGTVLDPETARIAILKERGVHCQPLRQPRHNQALQPLQSTRNARRYDTDRGGYRA